MPVNMETVFDVEFRGDHIHVELGREYSVDPATRDAFWRAIHTICDEHGSRRVLVEGFVPEGERETAEVIDAGQRTATVPNLWLAFHLEDFVATDQTELFEVIAASHGVRVRFFSNSEHALRWLRNNAPA